MRQKKTMRARKLSVLLAVMLVVTMLVGCGEAAQTQFTAPNGTYSIMMDETWSAESMGDDSILAIFSKDETRGIVVMQFPKEGMEDYYSSIDDIKGAVEMTFTMNSVTSADAPASVAGMTNVCADTSSVVMEGQTEECYTVYGETDYAYYSILYMAKKVSDKRLEKFHSVCGTFAESVSGAE